MLEGPGAWAGSEDGVTAIKISYSVEHLQENQTFSVAKIYSLLNFYCVWLSWKHASFPDSSVYSSIFFICLLIDAC